MTTDKSADALTDEQIEAEANLYRLDLANGIDWCFDDHGLKALVRSLILQSVEQHEAAPCVHADDPKGCYRVRCQLGNKCVDDNMSPRQAQPEPPAADDVEARFVAEHGHRLAQLLGITSFDIADRDAQIMQRLKGEQPEPPAADERAAFYVHKNAVREICEHGFDFTQTQIFARRRSDIYVPVYLNAPGAAPAIPATLTDERIDALWCQRFNGVEDRNSCNAEIRNFARMVERDARASSPNAKPVGWVWISPTGHISRFTNDFDGKYDQLSEGWKVQPVAFCDSSPNATGGGGAEGNSHDDLIGRLLLAGRHPDFSICMEAAKALREARAPRTDVAGGADRWSLINPQGVVVATEASCIKAWARIDGYKPTVEGLLGYEQHGWRVVPISPPSADAAAEDKYVIERLSTVLAGVASALLGEEADRPAAETLQKLPEEAAKLRLELDLYRAQAADAAAAPADARAVEGVRAWETDDGRVISNKQKQQALRDGGASASSVRPFSIALGRIRPVQAVEAVATPFGWAQPKGGNYFTRSEVSAKRVGGLVPVYLAPPPPAPASAWPTDDQLWDQTLRERDEYHEAADKLAAAIAKHFGVDIGEHSNVNCPWNEALEVIENAAPASAPVGTARDTSDSDSGDA
ncbi:hypothetical protein QZM15_33010 [Burkholderia sp. AU44665]|uniref:hypothetical protein n=1 Tax=Burkholderia sp. AU44665 TaxID=3059203 RepID=UPI0026604A67|nr:hypothetical protein [Burkholderia sp. AU44665]MDN7703307.1 hypothetical protein [Burkholderia sp. AU44665]